MRPRTFDESTATKSWSKAVLGVPFASEHSLKSSTN
jgi:hypothetical protein